jgi:hypothetical protein
VKPHELFSNYVLAPNNYINASVNFLKIMIRSLPEFLYLQIGP